MGSGNWFGNIVSSLIVTIIMAIIGTIGSILGIFGAWDVTVDQGISVL